MFPVIFDFTIEFWKSKRLRFACALCQVEQFKTRNIRFGISGHRDSDTQAVDSTRLPSHDTKIADDCEITAAPARYWPHLAFFILR